MRNIMKWVILILILVSSFAQAADTLTISPTSLTLNSGDGETAEATLSGSARIATIMSISGLPSGVTANCDTRLDNNTRLCTFSAGFGTAAGSSTVTIKAIMITSASVQLDLTVTNNPSFSLIAIPAQLALLQGSTMTDSLSTSLVNGLTGLPTFTASGLPAGVSASFGPTTGGTTTMTLSASSDATVGNSTVMVTATIGTISRSLNIPLMVSSGAALTSTNAIKKAYTGSWYDPSQSGHGFIVEVLPNNMLSVYWFVYTNTGDQAWIMALGNFDPASNTVTLPAYITAAPGQFPPNFDPSKVTMSNWGSLTFAFADCNNAVVSWNPLDTGSYSTGSLNLTRLTAIAGLTCTN